MDCFASTRDWGRRRTDEQDGSSLARERDRNHVVPGSLLFISAGFREKAIRPSYVFICRPISVRLVVTRSMYYFLIRRPANGLWRWPLLWRRAWSCLLCFRPT